MISFVSASPGPLKITTGRIHHDSGTTMTKNVMVGFSKQTVDSLPQTGFEILGKRASLTQAQNRVECLSCDR